jgi:hypothetical protein
MFSKRSVLQALSLASALASCGKSEVPSCYVPGPCEGPPGLLLVAFREGTSQAEVDTSNAAVDGHLVWAGSVEQLRVDPASECPAIEKLRNDTHVISVNPELYLYPQAPGDGGCPASPSFDASSCTWSEAGDVILCEDGSVRIVK